MLVNELDDFLALSCMRSCQLLIHDSRLRRIGWVDGLGEVRIVAVSLERTLLRRQLLQIRAQPVHEAAGEVGWTLIQCLLSECVWSLEHVNGTRRGLRRLIVLFDELLQLANPTEELDEERKSALEPSIGGRVGCDRQGAARLRTEAEVSTVAVRRENFARLEQHSVEGDACRFEQNERRPPLLAVDQQLAGRGELLRTKF